MAIEKMYTSLEVAQILQLNHQTTLRFFREKRIKTIKIGRRYMVKETDLNEFLGFPQGALTEQVDAPDEGKV